MSQYLSAPGFKKHRILEKRLRELVHVLNADPTTDLLARAAERVRAARLNQIKAAKAMFMNPACHEHRAWLKARWDCERDAWQARSVEEIVDWCRDTVKLDSSVTSSLNQDP